MLKPDYKKMLNEYFRNKPNILCVYLFGSVANAKESPSSDVDIAVLYNNSVSASKYTDQQIDTSIDLSLLLDKNVDVIILNRAAPYLKFQIIQKGIRVYENPKRESRIFEARSILEYFDFEPIKNLLELSLIKRIKET